MDNRLFLSSLNLPHSSHHTGTWCPNSMVGQMGRIAISLRWGGCVQNCRSYRFIHVELDHARVLMRFLLQLNDHQRKSQSQLVVQQLPGPVVRTGYEQMSYGLDQTVM